MFTPEGEEKTINATGCGLVAGAAETGRTGDALRRVTDADRSDTATVHS